MVLEQLIDGLAVNDGRDEASLEPFLVPQRDDRLRVVQRRGVLLSVGGDLSFF